MLAHQVKTLSATDWLAEACPAGHQTHSQPLTLCAAPR